MSEGAESKFAYDLTCCILECGKLGEHVVGAAIWSVADDLKRGKPYKFETGLTVCSAHLGKMPQTCPNFFTAKGREQITHAVRAAGKPPPNYNSAEWLFLPMPAPAKSEAN